MGFLDRFKNNSDEDEDEDEDDEIDDDEEDDEQDDEQDDEEDDDEDEESGGGFLGKFMGGGKGIFGKVLKKGGSDNDDEDEDDDEDDEDDDEDAVALPASAPPLATGQESGEAVAGSKVTPAAASPEVPDGAAPSPDAATAPGNGAGEAPAPATVGTLAETTPEASSNVPAPVEEPPQIDLGSKEETSGADEFDLNDLFGEKQEVDPRLKNLAEAQENTPAAVLAEELNSLLKDLEQMMPNP